jgi:hypothetical protein
VGKTAIVEGLAQRIVAGDVPPGLLGAALLELDLAALAAGCMMPGEFEVGAVGAASVGGFRGWWYMAKQQPGICQCGLLHLLLAA